MARNKSTPLRRRNALGRGLGAILPDSPVPKSPAAAPRLIDQIPLKNIKTNPYQPRQIFSQEAMHELQDSIRTHGIIQPITVRATKSHTYELISGERRLQACKALNFEDIPAFVRKANDQEMLEMALIENIQRESLNAIDIALSYQRLLSECKLTQEKLSKRVSKDRSTVTNYLRLLKLPPSIQAALRDQRITMGHARSLLALEEDAHLQLSLLEEMVHQDLSVRQVEERIRRLRKPRTSSKQSASAKSSAAKETDVADIVYQLSQKLEAKIRIDFKKKSREAGNIHIPFASQEDLQRILDLLLL